MQTNLNSEIDQQTLKSQRNAKDIRRRLGINEEIIFITHCNYLSLDQLLVDQETNFQKITPQPNLNFKDNTPASVNAFNYTLNLKT